jgi:hypothetical protein
MVVEIFTPQLHKLSAARIKVPGGANDTPVPGEPATNTPEGQPKARSGVGATFDTVEGQELKHQSQKEDVERGNQHLTKVTQG